MGAVPSEGFLFIFALTSLLGIQGLGIFLAGPRVGFGGS